MTAYFDLGTFQKGSPNVKFSTQTYLHWVKTFKYLNNSVVAYTDSIKFRNLFRELRHGMEHKTKVILVKRQKLWTFKLKNQIKAIFSKNGYPKHYPNTVIPEYSCAQHSKYAVLADTIRQGHFKSEYYAWLDIGYFRDIIEVKRMFTLSVPVDFDVGKIAMNLVYPSQSRNLTYRQIVYHNIVWVGGGMLLGTPDVVLEFETQYRHAVMFLLSQRLISTDQQVLLSMYSSQGQTDMKPKVQLQLYSNENETNIIYDNPWFYLGYRCLHFAHAT